MTPETIAFYELATKLIQAIDDRYSPRFAETRPSLRPSLNVSVPLSYEDECILTHRNHLAILLAGIVGDGQPHDDARAKQAALHALIPADHAIVSTARIAEIIAQRDALWNAAKKIQAAFGDPNLDDKCDDALEAIDIAVSKVAHK